MTLRAVARRHFVLGAGVCLLAGPASADDPAWFENLMARMARIEERRATFTEERHFRAVKIPFFSQGALFYRRPAHLEKITEAPQPERIVVDGELLSISGGDGGAQTISLAEHPEAAVLVDAIRGPLSGDLSSLRAHYGVAAEGSAAAWRMSLAPSDPMAAKLVRSVTISGEDLSIGEIAIMQANGDTQRMTIRYPA